MAGGGGSNRQRFSASPSTAEYLKQLLRDKQNISTYAPNTFLHCERLLNEEIERIRMEMIGVKSESQNNSFATTLPEPIGEKVQTVEKVFIPTSHYPNYNFVGRLLGPRGMTMRQLELNIGCKIKIRGKGSLRDRKREDQLRGKQNWEHLQEELHVVIEVEDTQNRAAIKLAKAKEEINKLLIPVSEEDDEIKKKQLEDLRLLNGVEAAQNMASVNTYNNVYATVIPTPVDTGLVQYATTGSLVGAFQPSITQLQSGIIGTRAPSTVVRPMRIHGVVSGDYLKQYRGHPYRRM